MNNFSRKIAVTTLLAFSLMQGGCVLTKVVSVPLRLGGAVISIVPVAGNPAHDSIDEAADTIDKVPL
mgnify:FL=1